MNRPRRARLPGNVDPHTAPVAWIKLLHNNSLTIRPPVNEGGRSIHCADEHRLEESDQHVGRDLAQHDLERRVAPRSTPAEIIEKLNKEINVGLADPKLKARLTELGPTVMAGSPADFGRFIASETEKWAKVIKFAGIKAE